MQSLRHIAGRTARGYFGGGAATLLHRLIMVRASLKEARHSIECNRIIIAYLTHFFNYYLAIGDCMDLVEVVAGP